MVWLCAGQTDAKKSPDFPVTGVRALPVSLGRSGCGTVVSRVRALTDQLREKLDDLRLVTADLLAKRCEAAVKPVHLLIKIADLQTHRREVGLDDPEFAVALLRDLFETPSKSGELAVSDGVLGHAQRSCQITKTRRGGAPRYRAR
ncbi:hypothetical protein [Actinacidiphila soli]|uniref:hypothetical protein n=1 Tax=Actinacidiphila soli TaxID=2487275 RepID=UPI000FCA9085|nr:hypothetical protein [Actinacidiphila soli]